MFLHEKRQCKDCGNINFYVDIELKHSQSVHCLCNSYRNYFLCLVTCFKHFILPPGKY